jgi:thiamine pyrophosphate-dependent acetolactate synthase large subunit-like protein
VKRFDCLKLLYDEMPKDAITVTSFTDNGRVWGYLRKNHRNLYNMHMGLCMPFATGIAAARPDLKVVAIDSDGSFLLDVGSIVTAASLHLKNLIVFVLDNQVYNTHGPTVTDKGISLERLAQSVDFGETTTVRTLDDFRKASKEALKFQGPHFIVAKIDKSRPELPGYHNQSDIVVKEAFVEEMKKLPYKSSNSRRRSRK